MKTFIAFVCLLACVFAQDTEEEAVGPSPTPTKLPQCFSGGQFYNGTALVVEEFQETCSENQRTCQTKVEVSQDTYRIYKQCQTPEACENNQRSNPQQCYSDEAEEKQEKVCHYCCQGDFCNDGSGIDISLPAAGEEA